MPQPVRVAIVVDREYGDRLVPLARHQHVWAIDSPTNKAVAERVWKAGTPEHWSGPGITTFTGQATATPEQLCAHIAEVVDQHHDEYDESGAWSELEVHGAPLTPALESLFTELGAESFHPTAKGFVAARAPREPTP